MQQEAAFLIWHHVLDKERKADELSGHVIPVCLTILDSTESTSVDKSCCAGAFFVVPQLFLSFFTHVDLSTGILAAISQSAADIREQVIKSKGSSNSATVVLHSQLQHSGAAGDLLVQYASQTLCLVAEDPAVSSCCLEKLIVAAKMLHGCIMHSGP
jgi:hypothetical protein